MLTVLVPHVGGPIIAPGAPTVLIGFLPAARMTDMVTCVGPPDMILMGSPTVLIEFLMAARMGDPTVHGGVIVLGEPTVEIGEAGMGSPGAVVVTPPPGGGGGGGGGSSSPASGPAETEGSGITAGASRTDTWTPWAVYRGAGRRGDADGGSGHEVWPGAGVGIERAERNAVHYQTLPKLPGLTQRDMPFCLSRVGNKHAATDPFFGAYD